MRRIRYFVAKRKFQVCFSFTYPGHKTVLAATDNILVQNSVVFTAIFILGIRCVSMHIYSLFSCRFTVNLLSCFCAPLL